MVEAVGLLRALTSRASRRRRSAWPALRRPRASSPTRAASRSGAWCAHCDHRSNQLMIRSAHFRSTTVVCASHQRPTASRSQSNTQPKAKSQQPKAKWCGPQVCQRGLVGQEDAMAHAQQTGHQVRISARNLGKLRVLKSEIRGIGTEFL